MGEEPREFFGRKRRSSSRTQSKPAVRRCVKFWRGAKLAVKLAIVRCDARWLLIAFIAATSRWLPNHPLFPDAFLVRVSGDPSWALPSQPKMLLSLSGRSVRDTVIPTPASSVRLGAGTQLKFSRPLDRSNPLFGNTPSSVSRFTEV